MDKVLIPPSGTIAIVEMPVVSEARVAFRALAYKRFKGGISLPRKGARWPADPQTAGEKLVKQAPIVGKSIDTSSNPSSHITPGNEDDAVNGATLYVKNLSFSTTDERLASTFHGLFDYAFARIQTKPIHDVPEPAYRWDTALSGSIRSMLRAPRRRRWTAKCWMDIRWGDVC